MGRGLGHGARVILLNIALNVPNSTPSSLASVMNISLPSVGPMLERLVKLGLAQRTEDPQDRRSKTIRVHARGKGVSDAPRGGALEEYAEGTSTRAPARRSVSRRRSRKR
jgi:hypothetical protein